MKLVKMSLACAVLLGASAFAIDNVKVSGDAKLFYNTNNMGYTKDGKVQSGLFDQGVAGAGGSQADTGLRVSVTGDFMKGVSFGATGYAVSTLGLENNLVSNTWSGAHSSGSAGTSGVQDAAWMGELWIAGTVGKTTAKAGRMELDTPLAFSEKWSIVPNTFEGAVLINQDIPDTTLVGAWVGKGNGANALGYSGRGIGGVDNNSNGLGWDGGVVGSGANFNTFMQNGAYAVAAINNSFKPLVAQAWYYNVVDVADAYWLQADWDCQLIKDVKVGVQYANVSPKGVVVLAGATKDSSAYAVKLGYEGIKDFKISAAYSKVDDEGTLKIANVATNNLGAAQSKLYSEAFMNYGYAGAPDARTYNVAAEYTTDIAKLGLYITNVHVQDTKAQVVTVSDGSDMREVTATATKSYGPLDLTLAYFSTAADDQNNGKRYDSAEVYMTLNF